MKYCTQCGDPNRDEARFCIKCGTKMAETPPPTEKAASLNAEMNQPAGSVRPAGNEGKMNCIKISCSHCNQHLEVPLELLGTVVNCPTCNARIQLPPPNPAFSPLSLTPPPQIRKRPIVPIVMTVAGMLLIAGAVVYFSYFSQVIDKLEDYKPCNPMFNFTLGDTTCGGTENGGWKLETFKKFYVNNKEIPVRATTVEKGGFISTKPFGKIIIRIDEVGMRGTKMQALTTPRQDKLLADFLGIKEATATDGGVPDGYRPCKQSWIFKMDGLTTWFRAGTHELDSGSFEKLLLNNREIQVVTKTIEKGGFISTKDFGKIMVKSAGNLNDGAIQVCLTAEQETKMADFLGDGSTSVRLEKSRQGRSLPEIRALAEQGDANAQFNLGVNYANGRGVSQDQVEAVAWYRKAADQGYAKAQNNVGVCYANGQGVTQDRSEAVAWYRKAADQGDAIAQSNLGNCYANGRGVSQDQSEAVAWYRKAADQGYAKAQSNLGVCYLMGRGVSQNYDEAYKWLFLAAKQSNAAAIKNMAEKQHDAAIVKNLAVAKDKLTPAQIAEGEQWANNWLIEHKTRFTTQ